MKIFRSFILIFTVLSMVALCACQSSPVEANAKTKESLTIEVQECSSLEEAYKIAGFKLNIPEEVQGLKVDSIKALSGTYIEVSYGNGAFTVRKQLGAMADNGTDKETIADLSIGFQNAEKNEMLRKAEIERNEEGLITEVQWDSPKFFFYAITIPDGMEISDVIPVIYNVE